MRKNRKSMVKIREGDVFQFEMHGSVAYGQIIIPGDVIYVVIFKAVGPIGPRSYDPRNLPEIALCGWTLDGRIYHGMWQIIDNAPLPKDVPRPCYKVGNDGILWVESFDGELKRQASEEDCQSLDYRTTIAPIRFEKAFAALHGLHEWDASFDEMRVDYARERERSC